MNDFEPFIESVAVGQGEHELWISIAVSLKRIADEMRAARKEGRDDRVIIRAHVEGDGT